MSEAHTIDTAIDDEAVAALAAGMRRACFTPGDAGYDEARVIWNGSVDKRPAIIARCSGVADVIDAVNFARANGVLAAVRGGGHNVAGNAVCDGGIVIDLGAINSVRVDVAARRVRVDAGAIIRGWRDFMAEAPEDISSSCLIWSIPALPGFPEDLHGAPVIITAAVHTGALEDGARLTQPLRDLGTPVLDLSGPYPYNTVQTIFDPLFVKAERRNYWKSLYLDSLDDNAIGRMVGRALDRPDPWSLIALWRLGGAMNRVHPAHTALGERRANYLYSLDTSWTDPADDDSAIAWTRAAWAEMKPFSRGGVYLNFPGQGEEGETLLRASYGDANFERLVEVKTKYDPENCFRLNQNIPPRPRTE